MFAYRTDTRGKEKSVSFPIRVDIKDELVFKDLVKYDHVTAEFKGNYRSNDNFLSSEMIVLDLDNDHSNNPSDWIRMEDIEKEFPNVRSIVVSSRNHEKVKGNLSKRPRFHVYFPISKITDNKEYKKLKEEIALFYPYFDKNALDAARFIFGVDNPVVIFNKGKILIDEYIKTINFEYFDISQNEIKEGSRNSTLSHFAGKILIRLGNTKEAYERFIEENNRCNPPLHQEELDQIWNSALKFYDRVSNLDDYIDPKNYNTSFLLKPDDYSDVGQAIVLAREYGDRLKYSEATDFLVYNDSYFEESYPNAQALAQELTTRQLEEAEIEIEKSIKEMSKNGAFELLVALGPKKALGQFNKIQENSYKKYEEAINYQKYAIKRRDTKYISAALKEVRPMIQIDQSILDRDEFLLNTPSGTIDLRNGKVLEHDSKNFITKQTSCPMKVEGMDIWLDAVNTFFLKDKDLIDYVQKIVGLSAIGKVYVEALIIAYGDGRNGKSTFWNAISRVLGTYSGNMSADMLTVGCRRNVKPELAEAKGKRLLIAAELEEGMRMNTSNVKQLCSTDEIFAEKKFKSPFSYVPSHTLVLYTNHLPRVGALDKGTWRRLIVIPFDAKIEGSSDIKNFTDYLVKNAGGAILSWIVDGARKVIEDNFQIKLPKKVEDAILKYKENNDWFSHFVDECCEVDDAFIQKSGELYSEYRSYCLRTGEFIRSTTDFYNALESEGFERKKTNKGVIVRGIQIKSEFEG